MRGEARDLVAQALGRDGGHLLSDLLVHLEVQSELAVVLLHDDTRGLLHGLGADTAHLSLC